MSSSLGDGQLDTAGQSGKVLVVFDGRVVWYPTGTLNVACNANAFYFPFDTQKCDIHILQKDTAETDYILTGRQLGLSDAWLQNLEWTVIDHEVTNRRTPAAFGKHMTGVIISYTLKRQPVSYILTVIAPLVLLFFVGLMVFALPADSGEKVSLCVACLMSFFIMQLMISQEIPKNWESLPIISKWSIIIVKHKHECMTTKPTLLYLL